VRRCSACAHPEHLLALAVLADMERRCGDVRDQLRAGKREIGRRRSRLPHVFADRRADDDIAETQEVEVVAGREVAVLVEHAVVRQVALAVDALHLAVRKHEARVEEIGVEVRRTDERRHAVRRARDLLDRAPGGAYETGAEEQILGGVPGDAKLREEHEIGVSLAGAAEPLDDASRVAVDVADDAIDLSESQSHRFSPLGRKL
jgi:hypothetical protein